LIADWLAKEKGFRPEAVAPIHVIAATCGILHDIGNPPFGHAGEQAMAEWFVRKMAEKLSGNTQQEQDFAKWGGNAQTIRLVAKLQVLSDQYGLNLTCGTLSALCKYLAPSDKVDPDKHEWSKPGYFYSENELITNVRNEVGTGDARNPITYLAEAADDIVYSSVDLEDGIKKRLLTWDMLEAQLVELRDEHTAEAIKQAKDKIGGGVTPRMRDEALAQAFRTYAIGELVPSVVAEFKNEYDEIMKGGYTGELVGKCSARQLLSACKKIGREFVYTSDDVLRVELLGRRILDDLLDIFWEGAEVGHPTISHKTFPGKAYYLMSSNYRQVCDTHLAGKSWCGGGAPDRYYRLQLVFDYIAGMTDSFAVSLYRQLTNG
jgi:dGTPase